MPDSMIRRASERLVCPVCQGQLRFVSRSSPYGGPRLYAEIHQYDCSAHGTVFLTREGIRGHGPENISGDAPPVREPRNPTPTLNTDSVAVPEPKED